MDRARMAGNSYAPEVSNMSKSIFTPSTVNWPWCISSTVRLYLDENFRYRNCVISDDFPTRAAPITTILCRVTSAGSEDDVGGCSWSWWWWPPSTLPLCKRKIFYLFHIRLCFFFLNLYLTLVINKNQTIMYVLKNQNIMQLNTNKHWSI